VCCSHSPPSIAQDHSDGQQPQLHTHTHMHAHRHTHTDTHTHTATHSHTQPHTHTHTHTQQRTQPFSSPLRTHECVLLPHPPCSQLGCACSSRSSCWACAMAASPSRSPAQSTWKRTLRCQRGAAGRWCCGWRRCVGARGGDRCPSRQQQGMNAAEVSACTCTAARASSAAASLCGVLRAGVFHILAG
jgi:hypothetical protein